MRLARGGRGAFRACSRCLIACRTLPQLSMRCCDCDFQLSSAFSSTLRFQLIVHEIVDVYADHPGRTYDPNVARLEQRLPLGLVQAGVNFS
eukprot:SAG11_NODE_24367_length_374_cov_0.992727_1_plen_90_part_10